MIRIVLVSLSLFLPAIALSQQQIRRDSLLKMDSIIRVHLSSFQRTDTGKHRPNISISAPKNLQRLGDSMKDMLISKYLLLFDSIYRSDEFLISSKLEHITGPVNKMKFLITYCLLSSILPTKGYIEALLRTNPCILLENSVPRAYKVKNPHLVKLSKREIRQMMKRYFENEDTFRVISKISLDKESPSQDASRRQPHFGVSSKEFEDSRQSLYTIGNYWNVAFCVIAYDNIQLKRFTVSYHNFLSNKYSRVDSASYAFAVLSPGDIYLSVTRHHSNKVLEITEPVIHVKQKINNALLDPYRKVWEYQKNRRISRKSTFIIHLYLLQ